MNKEQFDALMGKFDSFGTKLNELETKVATFGKQPEADKKTTPTSTIKATKQVKTKAQQASQLNSSANLKPC